MLILSWPDRSWHDGTSLTLPIRVARSKTGFPFVRRGIISPEGSQILPHFLHHLALTFLNHLATSSLVLLCLLRHAKANSLLLTGETVSLDSPYTRDLYYKILPKRENVLPAALPFANEQKILRSYPLPTPKDCCCNWGQPWKKNISSCSENTSIRRGC
jgi:enoyl-CoA hydratase/carnithine racemase